MLKTKIYEKVKNIRKYQSLLLMMLPGMVFLVIFAYVPMYGLTIAFKDYKFSLGILGSPWVGLKYFEQIFSFTAGIGPAVLNTILISTLSMIFGFPAPIIFALLLNEIQFTKLKKLCQTISYLPHFLSWVVVSIFVISIFSIDKGIVNTILRMLGFQSVTFLYDVNWWLFIIVFSNIWKGVGWGSVIYLAAIAGVNVELYDSAMVDGASRFQRAIHITLPGITPAVAILLILSASSLFSSNFEQIFNLMNTAVFDRANVIDTYIFYKGIQNFQFSLTTALGLIRNVIALSLVVVTNMIARRITDYAIW